MTNFDWAHTNATLCNTLPSDTERDVILDKIKEIASVRVFFDVSTHLEKTYTTNDADVCMAIIDIAICTIPTSLCMKNQGHNIKMHSPLAAANAISNTLYRLAIDNGIFNDITPLYQSISDIGQTFDDRRVSHKWTWMVIYLHLLYFSTYVNVPNTPLRLVSIKNIDHALLKLVKDMCFTISKYIGEMFTLFCHMILTLYRYSYIIPHNVAFFAHCYIQILEIEFNNTFPISWVQS